MFSPVYSVMSNPHCVSRMGTVQHSQDYGAFSTVPMMPMYGADGALRQSIKESVKGWWQEGGKDWATGLAKDQVEQKLTSSQTGPTPVPTTTRPTTVDPKERLFTTGSGKTAVTMPKTGKPTLPKVQAQVPVPTAPKVIPMGPQIAPKGFRPPVQERTFLEKIADNKFQILLGSSALLLGVILIQRRLR